MFTNLYLKSTLNNKINKSRPLISVIFDDANSELTAACLQLSTLSRAHSVSGQGKSIYEAIIDGLHLKLKSAIFSWMSNIKLVQNCDLPNSFLLIGPKHLEENIKISNLVLPVTFRVSSVAAWFNDNKKAFADNCNIVCFEDSEIAKYLKKRNYYGLVTYGYGNEATVGAEDASQYGNGYRWKLITDGKTLPMSLNGVTSEKQVLNWLAAIALAKSSGASLTSIIAQFQTEMS